MVSDRIHDHLVPEQLPDYQMHAIFMVRSIASAPIHPLQTRIRVWFQEQIRIKLLTKTAVDPPEEINVLIQPVSELIQTREGVNPVIVLLANLPIFGKLLQDLQPLVPVLLGMALAYHFPPPLSLHVLDKSSRLIRTHPSQPLEGPQSKSVIQGFRLAPLSRLNPVNLPSGYR